MKIQIIALGMTDQSHRKYYNTQDMGLGRALAAMGHEVDMYSFIRGDTDETVEFSDRLRMHYLHSRCMGFHSLHPIDFITGDVDGVICFSDNQMNFGRVAKRCAENNVILLPYVGALDSHNASSWKKKVLDLFASNMRYYRRMTTLAKTPNVMAQMQEQGVSDLVVAPCCLDLAAVRQDALEQERDTLRQEIGLAPEDKVLLYLARLIEEKHPLEMVELFAKLSETDSSYRMISIGQGELQQPFEELIASHRLTDRVVRIASIPNSEVWKYYRMADVMVNLNRVEIFGMAILESMYYECPVVARRAPGPEYILTDGEDGFLCDDSETVLTRIRTLCTDASCRGKIIKQAKEHILHDFVWESTAQIMLDLIEAKKHETGK